ncbi:polysaccharide deacetylase family protein [Pseudonocardiaceae bacterium YIM PH 21723]|nr:polysaccharide deacetylase family protein [Pseudonocardiaceae bacterium YIM PH 21723]
MGQYGHVSRSTNASFHLLGRHFNVSSSGVARRLLAVVTLVVLAACSTATLEPGKPEAAKQLSAPRTSHVPEPEKTLPAIPGARPGAPVVVFQGPEKAKDSWALTLDDGVCPECIAGYVKLAEQGMHLTFCPNGQYAKNWEPMAARIKKLVAQGRVQVCNHTMNHKNLLTLSDAQIEHEIQSNEDWIQHTFGTTSRPWLRPPFGNHNPRVDAVAARLGFTHIAIWNGSFGDSGKLEPNVLLGEVDKYLKPRTLMLAHVNYPTAINHFAEIQKMADQRGLRAVTLDEMFGTSRIIG